MELRRNAGLYREILTKAEPRDDPRFNSFSLTDANYSTFINVAIWRSLEDFDREVGPLIPTVEEVTNEKTGRKNRQIQLDEFEFKLRERIILSVIADRDGGDCLPPAMLQCNR